MQSLKDVIAALRRELDVAFAENEKATSGVRLMPERVVVSLGFSSGAQGLSFESGKAGASNSVTIEFRCEDGKIVTQPVEIASVPTKTKPLETTDTDRVTKQLSRVFGNPGFDSSARASVFREALEHLSEPEIAAVVSATTSETAEEQVKRGKALVKRVCQSGPSGAIEGMKILAELFAQHEPSSLLNLIATVWKTQDDWL